MYYRNALIRRNYFNNYLNPKENNGFLIKFYEDLLLGKNNKHSRDLVMILNSNIVGIIADDLTGANERIIG